MERIDRFIYNAISHARTRFFVVAYDISDDRERQGIADMLTGFGTRVQYSVFECRLNKRRHDELLNLLGAVTIQTGFVRVYGVQPPAKIRTFGKEPEGFIDPEEDCIVI